MHQRLLTVGLMALALGLGAVAAPAVAREEKAPWDKVPAAVQATIKKHAAGAKILEVEAVTKKGKKVFDVEVQRGGKKVEFSVSSEGKYLGVEDDEDEEKDEAGSPKHEAKCEKEEARRKNACQALKKAPKAVQATVRKLLGKGKIVEFGLEKEGEYELDYQVTVTRSAAIGPDGKIREREETIEVSALPKGVKAAVKKLYPGGKIERAETSTSGHRTVYELKVVVGKKRQSVVVSREGKHFRVKPEADEKDEPK